MAKDTQNPELVALSAADPKLGWIFGVAFPYAKEVKQKTGKTATWAEIMANAAPPAELVKLTKTDQNTGEVSPIVDGTGKPLPAARIAFRAARQKYRPTPKNAYGDKVVFQRLKALESKINAASGISRGRKGGRKLSQTEVKLVEKFNLDEV